MITTQMERRYSMKTITKELIKEVNEEFQDFCRQEGLDPMNEDDFEVADESFVSAAMEAYMAEAEAEKPDTDLVWSPVFNDKGQITDIELFDAEKLEAVTQVVDIDRNAFAA